MKLWEVKGERGHDVFIGHLCASGGWTKAGLDFMKEMEGKGEKTGTETRAQIKGKEGGGVERKERVQKKLME